MLITRARGWRRRRAVATTLLLSGAFALTFAFADPSRAQERDPFASVPTTVAPDTVTVAAEATTTPPAFAPPETLPPSLGGTDTTAAAVPGPPPGGLAFSGSPNPGIVALGIALLLAGLALTELFRPRLIRRGIAARSRCVSVPTDGTVAARLWLHGGMAKNVLGGDLEPCSYDPLTGFYRDGCCESGGDDPGVHAVCVEVTASFLEFSRRGRQRPQHADAAVRLPRPATGRPVVPVRVAVAGSA